MRCQHEPRWTRDRVDGRRLRSALAAGGGNPVWKEGLLRVGERLRSVARPPLELLLPLLLRLLPLLLQPLLQLLLVLLLAE